MIVRNLLSLLIILLVSGTLVADDYQLDIEVSPVEAKIGDPVTITYTLTAMEAHSLRIDPVEAGTYFQVKDQKTVEDRDLLGVPRLRRILTIVPFTVGKILIPTRVVEVIDAEGKSTIGSAPPVLFNVVSIIPSGKGPEKAKNIKGIIPFIEEDTSWVWILAVSILVPVIAALIWFMSRSSLPASLKELVKLSPAQRALEELNRLRKTDYLKRGLVKSFYTKLSFILKRYLGLRYHLLALEMTSKELSQEVNSLWQRSKKGTEKFDQILNICDLAKFAKYVPEEREGLSWINATRQMILNTRDDIVDSEGQDMNQGGKE